MNDWECQRICDFHHLLESFQGCTSGEDKLKWKGCIKGEFSVVLLQNHRSHLLKPWPWKLSIWEDKGGTLKCYKMNGCM